MLFSVDLIEHDGNDLRDLPLIKRRLKKLLPKSTPATSSCPPILGVYMTRTWANARCCLIFTSIQQLVQSTTKGACRGAGRNQPVILISRSYRAGRAL